jgi:hypothetical protein
VVKLGIGWRILDWAVGIAIGWYLPRLGPVVLWWGGAWVLAVTLFNTLHCWHAWRKNPTRVASDAIAEAVASIEDDPEYLRQTVEEISKAEAQGRLTSQHLWRYFSKTLVSHHVPQVTEAAIVGFILKCVFIWAGRH